uniref:NADH-ubiquinone oxidoreductase chain 2 n=1 Tax=Staphylinidae sp. BMNH 1274257 TaxID=1796576 RepID=A0A126TF38_9COLE|nr:NADH dehydrogenase subunit 2 [Staphylinidae sp. BMNH 1274257]
MFYHYKLFFLLTLMFGSLISISSNSWMGMWMGLEINLLAFIPLIQEKNNSFSIESSLKYFLVQALASMILLFSLIMLMKKNFIMYNIDNSTMLIFNSMLLTKMGMPPFHFWFPEVIEGLNWLNCLILLTWQKITPMILVMYNINFQYYTTMIIASAMIISGIMGLNQTSLRKIMAYSSINHMAWMLAAMLISETIWFIYLIIYVILSINILMLFKLLNIYYYNQLLISLSNNFPLKFIFAFNFLSLGGLPPFIGFFPKWLTIQFMLMNNFMFLSIIMVILTLLTLFYYMRLIYNIYLLINKEINFHNNLKFKTQFLILINLLTLMLLIMFSLSLIFI